MIFKFKKEIRPEIGKEECIKKFLFLPVFAVDKDNYYIFWLENAMITRKYYVYSEWQDIKINGLHIDNAWNNINN